MRDRVLLDIFVCFQFNKMVSPNLGGRCAYESQGFVMVGTFLQISVVPRVCFARHITYVVWLGILASWSKTR